VASSALAFAWNLAPCVQLAVEMTFHKTANGRYFYNTLLCSGRDSSVTIETGYRMDGHGSIPGRDKVFLFISQRPDLLWAPSDLISNGYWGTSSG
jgi:hypothetical protein